MHRLLQRTVLLTGFAMLAALPMRADDASKQAKLHEMFRLAHIDQAMTQAFEQQTQQLPKMMQAMFPGAKITPEQQKDIDAFSKKMLGIVQTEASWTKLEPQFTQIYASTYSEQEIDGLIAFYKSPVGQEMVAKQPELVNKSQGITQNMMVDLQPKMRDAVMQFAKEMQAKYPNGAGGSK